VLQPDNKILVSDESTVHRINADGSIDPSWSVVDLQVNQIQDMALAPDGKVFVTITDSFEGDDWQSLITLHSDGTISSTEGLHGGTGTVYVAARPDSTAATLIGSYTGYDSPLIVNDEGIDIRDIDFGSYPDAAGIAVDAQNRILVLGGYQSDSDYSQVSV